LRTRRCHRKRGGDHDDERGKADHGTFGAARLSA
jgi:hypothetical protein